MEEDKNKPLQDQCQICLQQATGKGGLSSSAVGYSESENTQTSLLCTAVDSDLGTVETTTVHVGLPYSIQQQQLFAFKTEQCGHSRGVSPIHTV